MSYDDRRYRHIKQCKIILKICTYNVRGLAAGGERDRQFDGAGDESNRRSISLQGHYVKVWRCERRGYRVHEGQAGHQQPSYPVRASVRNCPTGVHRHFLASRRPDTLDLPWC